MVTASKLGPLFVSASEVPAIDEILPGLPVGPDPGSLTEETRLDFVEILLHCFALDSNSSNPMPGLSSLAINRCASLLDMLRLLSGRREVLQVERRGSRLGRVGPCGGLAHGIP